MKTIIIVVGLLAGWLLPASAAVLFEDSFPYGDGPLVSVSGGAWIHHNGSVTGEVNLVSGRVFLTQTETEDVSAPLAGQPYPAATNVFLYAGFTLNVIPAPSGTGGFFAHYKAAGTAGAQAGKIYATTNGVTPGFFRVGVANSANTANVLFGADLSFNTDYQLITRYAPSNAATTLWINSFSESDPAVTATDPATTISAVAFAWRQSLASGNGMGGLFVDNLVVATTFGEVTGVPPLPAPPVITTQPESQTVVPGATVAFSVTATGYPPPTYQWQFQGTNLAEATNATLTLANVAASQAGDYRVVVSNLVDMTNSQVATLTVAWAAELPGFSLLTYNVKGNGAADWSANAPQLQAIARQLQYLQPDIITFNEIPWDLKYEMTNFIAAFLPGYQLAMSSGTDGSICSAIASRFAITRATSWLDSLDLRGFGYSNANNATDNFTRDLYEAQINVPGFVRPLHVFTTHLKSSADGYTNAAAKRAAEAAAITNFFATNLFVLHPHDPYTLTGDMNESDTNTLALQRLISPATRLFLTNPKNPGTGSGNTYNSTNPSSRIDYIFPNQLLFANIQTSQVFRTDRLNPQPPNLNSNDGRVASDHLPVLMVFNNPYDQPFKLLSLTRSNASLTLKWESVPGQPYRVDASSNLVAWNVFASNLTATSNTHTFSTNLNYPTRYFRVYRVP